MTKLLCCFTLLDYIISMVSNNQQSGFFDTILTFIYIYLGPLPLMVGGRQQDMQTHALTPLIPSTPSSHEA